jgi:hypothetical protein
MSNPPIDLLDSTPNLEQKPNPLPMDLSSVLQFVFSLATILGLWLVALVLAVAGIFGQVGASLQGAGMQFLLLAGGLGAGGLMLLPSAITAFLRMRSKPLPVTYQPLLNLNLFVPVLLLLPVLGIGYLVSSTPFAWLVLPPLHVLAVVLPVLFFLILGLRKLPTGSPQRRSGVFGTGLVLGPFLILMAEIVALVFLFIIVGLYIAGQPGLLEEIQDLAARLALIQGDQEELLNMLAPYLANPWVIYGTLFFIALVVPIIEEFFKPIGVWFLARRKITPAAGFAAGALSGAGYAIFESMALSSGGQDWTSVVVVRIATAVIHITTTAFTGWALAYAFRKKGYLRLLLTYVCVVFVHGLWNATTLMIFVSESERSQLVDLNWGVLPAFSVIGPVVLVCLTIGGLAAFIGMNRALRSKPNPQVISET